MLLLESECPDSVPLESQVLDRTRDPLETNKERQEYEGMRSPIQIHSHKERIAHLLACSAIWVCVCVHH